LNSALVITVYLKTYVAGSTVHHHIPQKHTQNLALLSTTYLNPRVKYNAAHHYIPQNYALPATLFHKPFMLITARPTTIYHKAIYAYSSNASSPHATTKPHVNGSTASDHEAQQSHMLIPFQHCTSSNTTKHHKKATCDLSDVTYADVVFV